MSAPAPARAFSPAEVVAAVARLTRAGYGLLTVTVRGGRGRIREGTIGWTSGVRIREQR